MHKYFVPVAAILAMIAVNAFVAQNRSVVTLESQKRIVTGMSKASVHHLLHGPPRREGVRVRNNDLLAAGGEGRKTIEEWIGRRGSIRVLYRDDCVVASEFIDASND